jgi:hypothetical protein
MEKYMLLVNVHVYVHAACPFHDACPSTCCKPMFMLHLHVNAPHSSPCSTDMDMRMDKYMLHVHIPAACPCPSYMSMSMRMPKNAHAACPHLYCMPMSMLHFHFSAACTYPRCMLMSNLHAHVYAVVIIVSDGLESDVSGPIRSIKMYNCI